MYYVYLLACRDNTLYCGYTNNLEKRLLAHNSGKGAKYTKSRLPVRLVYSEAYSDKSQALKRECAVKKLKKYQKQMLIDKQKAAK